VPLFCFLGLRISEPAPSVQRCYLVHNIFSLSGRSCRCRAPRSSAPGCSLQHQKCIASTALVHTSRASACCSSLRPAAARNDAQPSLAFALLAHSPLITLGLFAFDVAETVSDLSLELTSLFTNSCVLRKDGVDPVKPTSMFWFSVCLSQTAMKQCSIRPLCVLDRVADSSTSSQNGPTFLIGQAPRRPVSIKVGEAPATVICWQIFKPCSSSFAS
jgi:hypothetical protein